MTLDPQDVGARARTASPDEPAALMWFKVYAGALGLVYVATAALSLVYLFMDPADLAMSRVEARVFGALLLVMGLGLAAGCLLPLFLAPKPWVWTYDLVVICLGLTSCCCMPICIPLLIAWLKPEMKAYFGKT